MNRIDSLRIDGILAQLTRTMTEEEKEGPLVLAAVPTPKRRSYLFFRNLYLARHRPGQFQCNVNKHVSCVQDTSGND